MNYRFVEEALAEFIATAGYYNAQIPGLGESFIDEIEAGIAKILTNPTTWRVIEHDVRRYLVHRFPYGIYYTIENDTVAIWAVRSLQREEDDWRSRRG
jgi:plasmid stabilization system protein ParE